jgi:phosphohistidine phosphatase
MRHAKSSWDDRSISDFERALNDRGKKDAPLIAKELKSRGVLPKVLISSPAKRAKLTSNIIADGIDYKSEDIIYQDTLYESSEFNLIMSIKELDDSLDSVMIVGHNPSLTSVINKISSLNLLNLPTSGVVALAIKDSWASIVPYSAKEIFYIYPKMFK